jgi:hypothetical protein
MGLFSIFRRPSRYDRACRFLPFVPDPPRAFPQAAGAGVAGSLLKSIELHSDAVLAAPYNAAWKPQTVIRDDQCEFIGNAEKIGKLKRCASAGYVANNAWILVAAIVHLGSFHNFNAWRNPSFDHRNIPDPNISLWHGYVNELLKRAAFSGVIGRRHAAQHCPPPSTRSTWPETNAP